MSANPEGARTVLVTGGAGFIGSHLVDRLVSEGYRVRVLDDLSAGHRENLNPGADLMVGDVTDPAAVADAMAGVEAVFHLAADCSVARSVQRPLATDRTNTGGTLAVLQGALEAGARRVVYSSSSSVYGDSPPLPSPESAPVDPRSPYAVSKLAGEHYCRMFTELHGLETVILRYFNVYGPRQRPDSPYAAVVPLFARAVLTSEAPLVYGDGQQSRDFVFVTDVVAANLAALGAPAATAGGRVFNVGCGQAHSVLELARVLARLTGSDLVPVHGEARPGDVLHSRAEVTAARHVLGFEASVTLADGLAQTLAWLRAEGQGS